MSDRARPVHTEGRSRREWPSAKCWPKLAHVAVLGLTAFALGGCYVYAPIAQAPAPGMRVVLDLNDRGRVALSDSIGPSADRIEGEVASTADSTYVLRVTSIRYTNGRASKWTNEPLSIRTDLVRHLREKRFSRRRTVFVAASSVAALLAFALTTDLIGFGGLGGDGGGGPGPEQ